MMKRLTALLLALTLILTLFGCAAQPREKDAVDEFIEEIKEPQQTFVGFGKELEDMNDPLTVCMDLEFAQHPSLMCDVDVILNDFLRTLEDSGGLSDVEILYIPGHGEDRESVLEQIREDIELGEGPDVFIMNCSNFQSDINKTVPLFDFPEKAMERGYFLPLDEYMENNTRFTEWDKQTSSVLAAGKNWEGQQIIPLSYTLPMIFFQKADVDFDLTDKMYTWDDMLNDPEISRYGRLLADCATPSWYEGELSLSGDGFMYMEHILGDVVDFETGELSFTEEELQTRVQEIHELYAELEESKPYMEEGSKGDIEYFCAWLGSDMTFTAPGEVELIRRDDPLTMLPLYSDDGGVTASIVSWAAVNRNTDRPEEAYIVIDLLLRDYVQKNYLLYEEFLCGTSSWGIPMHEGLLHPDMPFGRNEKLVLTEDNYNEWCEVREQITGANFRSSLEIELSRVPLYNIPEEEEFAIYGYEEYFENVEQAVHAVYEHMENMMYE